MNLNKKRNDGIQLNGDNKSRVHELITGNYIDQ